MGKETISREIWIKRFESIHGKNLYDYSRLPDIIYQNKKVEVFCHIHNLVFQITPIHHYHKKHGCPKCKNEKIRKIHLDKIVTRRLFVEKAIKVHADKYDYGELPLKFSLNDNIIIFCKKHNHIFFCTGLDHLKGKGCEKS